MGFVKKIGSMIASFEKNKNFWFYVKCEYCNEVLRGRIDMKNDLSTVYNEGEKDPTYFCKKMMIGGNRCYRPIKVKITFDSYRNLIDRKIEGGEFVSEEVYQKTTS